jgi:small GTP-binding protein
MDFVRTKHMTRDGVEMDVRIWDTAGQEQFRNITYSYYKQADGVIIVFDLTSIASFKSVTPWLQSLYKH